MATRVEELMQAWGVDRVEAERLRAAEVRIERRMALRRESPDVAVMAEFLDSAEWWERREFGGRERTDAIVGVVGFVWPRLCWSHLRVGECVRGTQLHHIWYPRRVWWHDVVTKLRRLRDQSPSDCCWVCRGCHEAITALAHERVRGRRVRSHAQATLIWRPPARVTRDDPSEGSPSAAGSLPPPVAL